jgi:hypothetical protein
VNNRIEIYVNELFAGKPGDQYVLDIKEELLSNLNEKYDDLIADGKSEEEAYLLVIDGIGDVNDLINNGANFGYLTPADFEKKRNVKTLFVSIGSALYIISLAALFGLTMYGYGTIGIGVLIVICAVATGFVIYGANIGKDKYVKADDSFVENYKEKMLEDDRLSKLKRSVSSALWPLIVVIYFAVSLATGMWAFTWIIFLAGVFVQMLAIFLLSKQGERNKLRHGMLWMLAVVVYLVVSFVFSAWSWTWVIFLVTLAVQEIIRLIAVWKRG